MTLICKNEIGTETLSKQMLAYYKLDPWWKILTEMKCNLKVNYFHLGKYMSKRGLQIGYF